MGESPSVPHVSSSCSHWPLPTSPPCPLMSPSTSLMSPVFPCPPYILLHVPLSLQIPMSPPGPSGSLHPPPSPQSLIVPPGSSRVPPGWQQCPCVPSQARSQRASSALSRSPSAPGGTRWGHHLRCWGHPRCWEQQGHQRRGGERGCWEQGHQERGTGRWPHPGPLQVPGQRGCHHVHHRRLHAHGLLPRHAGPEESECRDMGTRLGTPGGHGALHHHVLLSLCVSPCPPCPCVPTSPCVTASPCRSVPTCHGVAACPLVSFHVLRACCHHVPVPSSRRAWRGTFPSLRSTKFCRTAATSSSTSTRWGRRGRGGRGGHGMGMRWDHMEMGTGTRMG